MQLSQPARRLGALAAGLSALSANLLGAGAAHAQTAPAQAAPAGPPGLMDEGAPQPGDLLVDGAVLFYQENGSRVRAIEPVITLEDHLANGDVVSGGLTYDSLTGATPNGAAPAHTDQTFTQIINQPTSSQVATTSASGGSTITSIPGTSTATSTYTQPAGRTPLASFHDHRFAANVLYDWQAGLNGRVRAGGAFSVESDYTSFTFSLGGSHDFNRKNTTLSLNASIEGDISRPHYGTPGAFENLNTLINGGNDHKAVLSVVAGLTQTLTRFWLTQLNYSFTSNQGYQSDPYRVLSVVGSGGALLGYAFENRPRSRQRHAFYWGNKLALGPTVADIGARYYTDSWGIKGITVEASEQVPITRYLYVKPLARYYRQSAANFYTPYLVGGVAEDGSTFTGMPQYASSDARLARFSATTFGARVGWRLLEGSELYLDGEVYRQSGTSTAANAPPVLAGFNYFSGVHAFSLVAGFKIKM